MNAKEYILGLIAEGEHEHQDFKFQISDAKKIARSISAFANNTGGSLLVGVKDNGNVAGVRSDEEIYMIEEAAQMYCQPPQQVRFSTYRVDGKTVVKADIDEAERKPVKAPDENGRFVAYFRVADENIVAGSAHVKAMRGNSDATLTLTERELGVITYLQEHGAITVGGITRLCHCSRMMAESIVVSLHQMNVVAIKYHNSELSITLAQ